MMGEWQTAFIVAFSAGTVLFLYVCVLPLVPG